MGLFYHLRGPGVSLLSPGLMAEQLLNLHRMVGLRTTEESEACVSKESPRVGWREDT